jgi:predicted SnoaL-like aldol condensation-catalyzing enzyme
MAETGAKGLKSFLRWARDRAPDATHDVKRLFVDGDHVIAHVYVVIEPDTRGNAVIDIFRVADGLVAEHWDASQPVPEQSANTNGMF